MNEVIGGGRAPGWLRVVAGLGLLWNLYGVYQYLMTVGMIGGAAEAAADATPAWVKGAFAVAVFGGALGCLGLLMLRRWSKLLLLLSLLAVLAMDAWIFLISGLAGDMPPAELAVTVAVVVLAILLAWLSHDADRKGWLS